MKLNRITKEQAKIGTMEIVIKDLKNIMFWAKFGLEKAHSGSAVENTINAIESYSEYLGYSETKKIEFCKYAPKQTSRLKKEK